MGGLLGCENHPNAWRVSTGEAAAKRSHEWCAVATQRASQPRAGTRIVIAGAVNVSIHNHVYRHWCRIDSCTTLGSADIPKPRQLEILAAATQGHTTNDIAKELDISVSCVLKHFTVIFEKLGVANRSEAVAIALRKHLLKI